MKNFRMIMMAAVCISAATFLNSCDEDEQQHSRPMDKTGTAGTYTLTAFTVPAPVDYNGDGTASADFLTESTCYSSNFIRLNPDHTYTKTDTFIDFSTGIEACRPYTQTGVWSVEGDVVTTTSSDADVIVYDDVPSGVTSFQTNYTLSSGTLTDAQTAVQYPSVDGSGEHYSATGDVTYVYTRAIE